VKTDKTIHIGLAMSGAASAGAYSAGVFDFLIEALDQWEKHRGEPEIPDHRVVISGMAGASAGAITSAVGAVAAARGPVPTGDPDDTSAHPAPVYSLPDLYGAWVKMPDFVHAIDSITGSLLDDDDIKEVAPGVKQRLLSLLNAKPLESIGITALMGEQSKEKPFSPKPYLAQSLHVYMTLTNLRGTPYTIALDGDPSGGYGMMSHADRGHFLLTGVGTATFASPWADRDHAIEIPIETLADYRAWLAATNTRSNTGKIFELDADVEQNAIKWQGYLEHTLCSSAFPLGLAARDLTNEKESYYGRSWPLPIDLKSMDNLFPRFPESQAIPMVETVDGADAGTNDATAPRPDGIERQIGSLGIPFAGIDGGVLDNDPVQIMRYTLMKEPPKSGPSSPEEVDRMVIMITPFPEMASFQADDLAARDIGLVKVISKLLPTLLTNARFKPEELLQALDTDKASRWMVSPRRHVNGVLQEASISCGLLYGFGGFLSREFREHDYQLGRKNCQDFLANWFGLDSANPHLDQKSRKSMPQPPLDPRAGNSRVAIIPLLGTASKPVHLPKWPRADSSRVEAFVDKAMKRADLLVTRAAQDTGGQMGTIMMLGWAYKLKETTSRFIRGYLLSDLISRDQFDDPSILALADNLVDLKLSKEEFQRRALGRRRVIAELVKSSADFRTVKGIARGLNLPEKEVREDLERGVALNLVYVTDNVTTPEVPLGTEVYCHISRKPVPKEDSYFARGMHYFGWPGSKMEVFESTMDKIAESYGIPPDKTMVD